MHYNIKMLGRKPENNARPRIANKIREGLQVRLKYKEIDKYTEQNAG